MKTCPICKARCFDDMEVCYGCLYRFDDCDDPGTPVHVAAQPKPDQGDGGMTIVPIRGVEDAVRIAVVSDPKSPQTIKRVTVEIGFPLRERAPQHANV